MNIIHPQMSKIISTEISFNDPSQLSSISACFLKLKLNYMKTVNFSFCMETVFELY